MGGGGGKGGGGGGGNESIKRGYVGYSGSGWSSQMQELKEKKMAARLLHQNGAVTTGSTGPSSSGIHGRNDDFNSHVSDYGHDRDDTGISKSYGLDKGFHPKYLRGLSGVEGEVSSVVVKPVRGVFDVDQFIATAGAKKKWEDNLQLLDGDGKVVIDKEKEKKLMEDKKIHDGLLQRLRAAAEYRSNSSSMLSAKQLSESLESVSIDSLLSQVLRFDLSGLSALAPTSNFQNLKSSTGSNPGPQELVQIPYRFLHEEQYIEYFHPLLIEEVKAALETNIQNDSQSNGNKRGGRFEKNITVHGFKVLSVKERIQKSSNENTVPILDNNSNNNNINKDKEKDKDKTKKKQINLLEIRVIKSTYKEIETHYYPKIPTNNSTSHSQDDKNSAKNVLKNVLEAPKYPSSSSFSASSISSAYMDLQKEDLVLILKRKSYIPLGKYYKNC